MEGTSSAANQLRSMKARRSTARTSVEALGDDVLCMIFVLLDLVHLIRCSAVCKSWSSGIRTFGADRLTEILLRKINIRQLSCLQLSVCFREIDRLHRLCFYLSYFSVPQESEPENQLSGPFLSVMINKLKLLQLRYYKQQRVGSIGLFDASTCSERSLNQQLWQLAMDQQSLSLQEGPCDVFRWKGHLQGFNKCRMKMGLILTGVGDKVMRLWSAESCRGLDEYFLPDKAPLIDFDFDEGKVVGLVGTRICIWRRVATREIFSSREGLFARGLCMRYVDPQAVIGSEDGKVRVFDMYSRKISQIIKMHPGSVSSLCFTDEQMIISGSSLGSIAISDLSSDQQVATLGTTGSAGIRTLCFNPSSYSLVAGSSAGYASSWDIRMWKRQWETRVGPNVLYSMDHLRNDKLTLVVGGIDGVLRVVDQDTGTVLSRWIVERNGIIANHSMGKSKVVERKKGIKISEDTRIDLMPNRPPITCLAVGMQKVVTTHGDRFLSVWKFRGK